MYRLLGYAVEDMGINNEKSSVFSFSENKKTNIKSAFRIIDIFGGDNCLSLWMELLLHLSIGITDTFKQPEWTVY